MMLDIEIPNAVNMTEINLKPEMNLSAKDILVQV